MWNLMLLVPALSWGPAGCAKHATVKPPIDRHIKRQLPGLWKDESGAEHRIIRARKTPAVASIIDADGETFQVDRSGWTGSGYTWDYTVPSTGFAIHVQVESIEDDVMRITWTNDRDLAGSEVLVRL